MQVDYIVVGVGLSGISLCEQLLVNNKSFVVFDDASQQSSTVAGGLYNPIVLKRFTSIWKAEEQLFIALSFYKGLEDRLGIILDYKIPVYRKFTSFEEQNNWFAASDKPILSKYLSNQIIQNTNPFVNATFGFGEVLDTGRIDVNTLLESYKNELINKKQFISEPFKYDDLIISESSYEYKHIKSKRIIFSEGFGVVNNPFFKTLPLVPAKGELLIIHAPKLKLYYILKSDIFLVPLDNDLYIVGATYNWQDKTQAITLNAKNELLSKLEKLISCSYTVVNQLAGIRPTVKDRRPLVGEHANYKGMYVLNGLGTRGVLIGPYIAKQLYNLIENNIPLERDVDIKRFE